MCPVLIWNYPIHVSGLPHVGELFRFLQDIEGKLISAARCGDCETIIKILNQGVNVDAANEVRHVIRVCLLLNHDCDNRVMC